jgi:hypothetical protein
MGNCMDTTARVDHSMNNAACECLCLSLSFFLRICLSLSLLYLYLSVVSCYGSGWYGCLNELTPLVYITLFWIRLLFWY